MVLSFQTKAEANQAIFKYIEVFYNKQRIHSANDNLPPIAFEEKILLNERVIFGLRYQN